VFKECALYIITGVNKHFCHIYRFLKVVWRWK